MNVLPGFVNEADGILKEGAVYGIHNSQFSKRLDGAEEHTSDDDEAEHLLESRKQRISGEDFPTFIVILPFSPNLLGHQYVEQLPS